MPRLHGIGMQLNGGRAVFQLVGLLHGGKGQLAFFTNGDKTHIQLICHHRAQNKAAGIQSCHHIGPHLWRHVAVHKSINQHPKDARVLQQGRDIAKLHASGRPVGHGPDVVFEIVVHRQRNLNHGLTFS